MGRKSTRENKTAFQLSRERLDMSREAAAEASKTLTEDRIDKIERGVIQPQDQDVLEMAEVYKDPTLCNYFCANYCAIGKHTVPEIKVGDLSRITLELLAMLNALNRSKDRLIDIAADGQINEDEVQDFSAIRTQLDKMSQTITALKLWAEDAEKNGRYGVKRTN